MSVIIEASPPITPMIIGRQISPASLWGVDKGHEYLVQPKLNGQHGICGVMNGDIVALNKHGKPLTKFMEWRNQLRYRLDTPAWRDTIVNGELVKLPRSGIGHEWFFPFDILFYRGKDVRRTAFHERLKILRDWIQDQGVCNYTPSVDPFIAENTRRIIPNIPWQKQMGYFNSDKQEQNRKSILEALVPGCKYPFSACLLDAKDDRLIEGVVLKHRDSIYMGGKNKSLIKARWE